MAASSAPRAIDHIPDPNPRAEQMQVLVLGLSRTGTYSMAEALEKLGCKEYHMKEVFANFKANHIEYWRDSLYRKYHNQPGQYKRREFDKILTQYSALTDAPCVLFSDELLEAYPDAKIILTNRDPDKWLVSMEASYYRILGWSAWKFAGSVDKAMIGPYTQILKLVLSFWTKGDFDNRDRLRQGFLDHYNHIRSVVPASYLLEYTPQDGWRPLCQFLGKPIPDGPYPKMNEGSYTADRHWWAIWIRLAMVLGAKTTYWASLFVLIGAAYWGWKRTSL